MDGLWTRANRQDEPAAEEMRDAQSASPGTPGFGLPNRLAFDEASAEARDTQGRKEPKLTADMPKQFEMSPAMLEWPQEDERRDAFTAQVVCVRLV